MGFENYQKKQMAEREERKVKARKLRVEGKTNAEIAKDLGVVPETVWRYFMSPEELDAMRKREREYRRIWKNTASGKAYNRKVQLRRDEKKRQVKTSMRL